MSSYSLERENKSLRGMKSILNRKWFSAAIPENILGHWLTCKWGLKLWSEGGGAFHCSSQTNEVLSCMLLGNCMPVQIIKILACMFLHTAELSLDRASESRKDENFARVSRTEEIIAGCDWTVVVVGTVQAAKVSKCWVAETILDCASKEIGIDGIVVDSGARNVTTNSIGCPRVDCV